MLGQQGPLKYSRGQSQSQLMATIEALSNKIWGLEERMEGSSVVHLIQPLFSPILAQASGPTHVRNRINM